ncbi:hypothetical protein CJ030_MR2G000748 [Morella rubra]|nr:hypothetical protein CJ030_MR2G000748 [Morella rubra]
MGEEDIVTEVAETVANGTVLPEKMDEAVTRKEEEQNGVKDIEENKKEVEKVEAVKMDEDIELDMSRHTLAVRCDPRDHVHAGDPGSLSSSWLDFCLFGGHLCPKLDCARQR